jgi:hypothetical protein
VLLTREETVLAAQLHAGDLINLAYGDNWTVSLPYDSIWYTGGWTPVTGHQFIEEAASPRTRRERRARCPRCCAVWHTVVRDLALVTSHRGGFR